MLVSKITFLVFCLTVSVKGQSDTGCLSKQTFTECTQEIGCLWCEEPVVDEAQGSLIRCQSKSVVSSDWCPTGLISSDTTYDNLDELPFSGLKSMSQINNETRCIRESTNEICSEHGRCTGGVCECYAGYEGEFCECDNFSCKKENGLLCSGRGECKCGQCFCPLGYSGYACECDMSFDNCRTAFDSDVICSNRGDCECNRCKCEEGFFGKYCEECSTCPLLRCDQLYPCAKCHVLGLPCDEKCATFEIDSLPKIEEDHGKTCRIPEGESCYIHFNYYYNSDNYDDIKIKVLNKRVCPEPSRFWSWFM